MDVKSGRGVGNTVETGELTALSVTTPKLAADSIIESKIADNAVQLEHLKLDTETPLDFVRVNAAGDGIETASPVSNSTSITIGSDTMTMEQWFEYLTNRTVENLI